MHDIYGNRMMHDPEGRGRITYDGRWMYSYRTTVTLALMAGVWRYNRVMADAS